MSQFDQVDTRRKEKRLRNKGVLPLKVTPSHLLYSSLRGNRVRAPNPTNLRREP
jgi:hypothetical protein